MGSRALGTGFSIGGLLVFGTTTSLIAKIAYELEGEGLDGHQKFFRKPWAMATIMFLGMSFCLPFAYIEEARARRKQRSTADLERDAAAAPLLGDAYLELDAGKSGKMREVLMLSIPTIFDLVATVLMNIGLLNVTASVYQMMRGAEMLFAALFTSVFLNRMLNKSHYLGILCCVAGIGLVGCSSVLSGEGSATQKIAPYEMLIGMGLIIGSQAVQAAQVTFEDYFMSDLNIAPLKIVGYEGVFGFFFMIAFMLPIVQHLPGNDGDGLHEDSFDSWHMITHSRALPIVLLIDMFALLSYNFAGMCVTGSLGAVFRTVLETMRTLFVWLTDLLLWYTPLGFSTLGESWNKYSWLQALGFAVLVSGTLVYSRGEEREEAKEVEEYEASETPGRPPLQRPSAGIAMPSPHGPRPRTSGMPMPSPSPAHGFKSTMNIGSFAGGGSLRRSLQGSPRPAHFSSSH